ncbi:MAG: TIGR03905 family TSCPD domain-containing protein [Clostridia bacterium]|nr:TIGR03905 family TSCPD domain-containing protein [Clostridia bacterium]
MKHYEYKTSGVCSGKIDFDIENGIVKNVIFYNGCSGNTQGIAKLVEGMKASEAAEKLKGIICNGKKSSCPDQLSIALLQAINNR